MGLTFSLPHFAASASADAVKILLDQKGGALDQLYAAAVERGFVAKTPSGRLAQAVALIAAGCALDQQFGDGAFASFVREALGKTRADLAKRLVEGIALAKG